MSHLQSRWFVAIRWHPRLLLVLFDCDTNIFRIDTNMPITDAKIRALKPKHRPYKISDGEGLHMLVQTNGSKLWRLSFRHLQKQRTLAIGKYPEVSLLDARRAREEAKRKIVKGVDPIAAKIADKRSKRIAAANTFQAVADEWFQSNKDRWVASYSERLERRLTQDLFPALGKRPIAEIQPLEVLDVIRKIEGRDAVEMAKRVMQMASGIFRYGVATARCCRDPTSDLKGALKPAKPAKHRKALSASEMPEFMAALERYDGDIRTKLAMSLIVLTFVRTAELRFAKWSEFEELEGHEPLWRIPAERMKMRRPHLVPLSLPAVEALRKLRKLSEKGDFLFASPTKLGVMSENTLIFALYRMGYHTRRVEPCLVRGPYFRIIVRGKSIGRDDAPDRQFDPLRHHGAAP